MSKCEVSSPNAPQLAQLIQSRFHPFDSSRVGLRPTVPAQCLADLLERNFAAHRPFQHVRSDLADGLRGLPVSLPVEELAFRLRHPGISADVDCKDAIEIDRLQSVGEAGVIPMMANFCPAEYCSGVRALRAKARSSGLSRMVIWPVSPRSKSGPARRRRSRVGSARRSTRRSSFRLFTDFRTRMSDCLDRSLIFSLRSIGVEWQFCC